VTERVGDWIQTFTGRQVYPLDLRPEEIDIADIAHSLSLQCRFNGHCRVHYSVAEHSVLICWAAKPEHKLAALMHDSAEAYLCDIPRPLKPSLIGYVEIEHRAEQAIADKFGYGFPLPPEIKELDSRLVVDERRQLMATPPIPWGNLGDPLGVTLHCWPPEIAEKWFLHMFDVCGGKR
jgi:hypothetical protein